MDQQQYVGLDVSLETTSVCVIDDKGAVVWRGKCASTLESIAVAVRTYSPRAVRVGLETGQLSNWLTLNLRRRGVPIVCLDARHAKSALSLQINNTDANDALGLAQIVRTGWYREVAVKSMNAHTLKMLLVARSQLVSQRQTIANTIRGLLKTFGLIIARGANGLSRSVSASSSSATMFWPLSSSHCSSYGMRCGSRSRYSTDRCSLARTPMSPCGT